MEGGDRMEDRGRSGNMKKKKVAIVNQRYGLEVNGGSEYYTRILAEHLLKKYDVEVLTTCARDYDTWDNFYEEGPGEVNGVPIRRFKTAKSRDLKKFKRLDRMRKYLPFFSVKMEQKWIEEQGPFCPDCIRYIEDHKAEYDVFIFVTYLYYLTAVGLKKAADKSILIPTAHDEPFLKMKLYKELFSLPKGYFFNAEEEKKLVYETFGTDRIPSETGGIGIEVPDKTDGEGFKKRHGLSRYILYVGRIDHGKNCRQLFEYFARYKERKKSDLKLVLMGKEMIEVPKREDILSLGFVSEEEKYDGMSGAQLLVLPSRYESLSIVVLDSMKLEVPVVVNKESPVLEDHCRKSKGGLYYENYEEFERAVDFLLTHEEEREEMGKNGRKYVEANFQWDVILGKLSSLIDRCITI